MLTRRIISVAICVTLVSLVVGAYIPYSILKPSLDDAIKTQSELKSRLAVVETPEYKIGVIYPWSGRQSWWSADAKPILQDAESDIEAMLYNLRSNATISFLVEDSNSTGEGAIAAAKRLKDAGVDIIVGVPTSGELEAIMDYTREAGLTIISSSSTSSALSKPDNIFRISTPENYRAKIAAEYAVKLGYDRVVVLYRNFDWGILWANTVVNVFEENNLEAYTIPFQLSHPGYMNYTETVRSAEKLVKDNRTLIFLVAWENEDYSILIEAQRSQILSGTRWFTASMYPSIINESLVEGRIHDIRDYAMKVGLLAPEQRPIASDLTLRLLEDAKQSLGRYPSYEHLYLYDALMLAARTLLFTNGETQKLPDLIPSIASTYYGATGWKKLNDNGDLTVEDTAFIGVSQSTGGYELSYYAYHDGVRGEFLTLPEPKPRIWFFSPEA